MNRLVRSVRYSASRQKPKPSRSRTTLNLAWPAIFMARTSPGYGGWRRRSNTASSASTPASSRRKWRRSAALKSLASGAKAPNTAWTNISKSNICALAASHKNQTRHPATSCLSSLRRLCTVHHPRNSELVLQHAELCRPKSLLQRHLHPPAFCQRVEDPLGLGRIFRADCNRESLRLGVLVRRTIRPHDHAGSSG